MYTIAQLQSIQNTAMAQHFGQKATIKSLATAQGKVAIQKLLNNEGADLYNVVKAQMTDGAAILTVNLNDMQKLVQEEKLPNNENLLNDVFDYINDHLINRKCQLQEYMINNQHSIQADDVYSCKQQITLCNEHQKDINDLKKKIKWHVETSTRASIFQWVRLLMYHEWPTCTMFKNRKEYDEVLKPIPQKQVTIPQSRANVPNPRKPRKRRTKQTPKNKTTVKVEPGTVKVGRTVCYKGAPAKALDVFQKMCFFYNWRVDGCTFGEANCKWDHLCSEEGCGENHPAHKHK